MCSCKWENCLDDYNKILDNVKKELLTGDNPCVVDLPCKADVFPYCDDAITNKITGDLKTLGYNVELENDDYSDGYSTPGGWFIITNPYLHHTNNRCKSNLTTKLNIPHAVVAANIAYNKTLDDL